MDIWHWSFVCPFLGTWYRFENLEMPVFTPNEYFWNKYWDGKDESTKWSVYAEAIREAMAECGNYKLSDSTLADK